MKKRAATFLSIIYLLLCTGGGTAKEEAPITDKDYQRAKELASFGAYEEAIPFFNKAIAKAPKDAERYRSRGHCYENMKRYEDAIKDFDVAIKIDPTSYAVPQIRRGNCLQKLGRHKEAIADYTRGMEIEKNGYNKQSKFFGLYMGRGRSYDLTGQYELAAKDYAKCLEYKAGKVDMGTVRMWYREVLPKLKSSKKKTT